MRRHNPKARVPFCSQLASEFGLSKVHTWGVCAGTRMSPDRDRIMARQKELVVAASVATSSPIQPQDINLSADLKNPQMEHGLNTNWSAAGGDKRRRHTCGEYAGNPCQSISRNATSDGEPAPAASETPTTES